MLIGLFLLYMLRLSRAPAEEPHLVGPARWLGSFPERRRRVTVVALFVWAAFVIVLCAEPFAHALVSAGRDYGISEFFLVQWLAPLASEAPEFIIAGLFAWRLQTDTALGALVSSKVNQWTLLVGSLPIVFAIASRSLHGLPIEGVQRLELLLTGAQSLFAVALIVNLRMSIREAWWIFGLFWGQFIASAAAGPELHEEVLVLTSAIYLVIAVWLLVQHRVEAAAADARRAARVLPRSSAPRSLSLDAGTGVPRLAHRRSGRGGQPRPRRGPAGARSQAAALPRGPSRGAGLAPVAARRGGVVRAPARRGSRSCAPGAT